MNKEKEDKIGRPYINFYIHIFAITIGIICVCVFLSLFTQELTRYRTIKYADFKAEYATLNYYRAYERDIHNPAIGIAYSVFFEFENDGEVYFGSYESSIDTEEEAKNMIGSRVIVYFDKNSKTILLTLDSVQGNYIGVWFYALASVLFFVLAVNSIVRLSIYYRKLYLWQKSDESLQEYIPRKNIKKSILIVALTLSACIIFVTLFVFNVINCMNLQVSKYEKVQAIISRYEKEYYPTIEYYYDLYYEYIAPDGTIYSGLWRSGIGNFDYVESQLNTTITIYVDHKAKKSRLDLNFDYKYYALYFYGTLTLASLAMCLHEFFKLKENKKYKKEIFYD